MESSVYPSLATLIADIRAFIYNGLTVLPLTVIGTSLMLSLMTANYALLFMLFSMIFIVPLALFGGNLLLNLLQSFIGFPSSRLWGASSSDLCDLIPPFPIPYRPTSQMSLSFGSYWLAMMSFFFGYAISNAVALLKKETQEPDNADDITKNMISSGIMNRKTQAISAIIATVIFAIIAIVMRITATSCEPYILAPIMCLVFASFGSSIYAFLALRGEDRLSDIFGIANRLLSPDAMNSTPYACLPYTDTSS